MTRRALHQAPLPPPFLVPLPRRRPNGTLESRAASRMTAVGLSPPERMYCRRWDDRADAAVRSEPSMTGSSTSEPRRRGSTRQEAVSQPACVVVADGDHQAGAMAAVRRRHPDLGPSRPDPAPVRLAADGERATGRRQAPTCLVVGSERHRHPDPGPHGWVQRWLGW